MSQFYTQFSTWSSTSLQNFMWNKSGISSSAFPNSSNSYSQIQ
jgi:hypothetical protein